MPQHINGNDQPFVSHLPLDVNDVHVPSRYGTPDNLRSCLQVIQAGHLEVIPNNDDLDILDLPNLRGNSWDPGTDLINMAWLEYPLNK
ncbi:MAG: hypothetical protein M0Q43_04145 [Methanothrix sp.]|nr:hypothetical protein [Methanothrix sp.]